MTTFRDISTPGVVAPDDLVAGTRRNHALTLDALHRAVTRNARVWRRISDYERPVPGLACNSAEAAAHLIGNLNDHTEMLIRHAKGGGITAGLPSRAPAWAGVRADTGHLTAVPDRNMHRLAGQLEQAAERYRSVAALVDTDAPVMTATGVRVDLATMTGLLLGEQLVHGRDIAQACERVYTIDADTALLALPAMLTVAPDYPPASRTPDPISFELHVRGGGRIRYAVVNGSAMVTAAGAPADCTISADPVALLLVGSGRVLQRTAVLRGQFRPGGRRPWRALWFGALVARP